MSVRINRALCVEVHKGGFLLSKSSLSWVMGTENKLTCWSQLDTLLSHYGSDIYVLPLSHFIASFECYLNDLCERIRESDEYEGSTLERLVLLKEQFSLLFAAQRRYSPDTIAFAFHLMCMSRTVYEMLREKLLILPNVSYLKRLSAVFRTDDSCQDLSAHTVYLKNKADMLALHERHVIL